MVILGKGDKQQNTHNTNLSDKTSLTVSVLSMSCMMDSSLFSITEMLVLSSSSSDSVIMAKHKNILKVVRHKTICSYNFTSLNEGL